MINNGNILIVLMIYHSLIHFAFHSFIVLFIGHARWWSKALSRTGHILSWL